MFTTSPCAPEGCRRAAWGGRLPRGVLAALLATLLPLVLAGQTPAPGRPQRAPAEVALAALTASQLPEAYSALEALITPAPAPAGSVAWAARLAQVRVLNQLDVHLTAARLLPTLRPGASDSGSWALASWLLVHSEVARQQQQPRAALRAARRATRLVVRLTAPGHPWRVQAWTVLSAAYPARQRADSALFYVDRARAELLVGRRGSFPLPSLAQQLAFSGGGGSPFAVYTLVAVKLAMQAPSAPPRVGPYRFASWPAAARAFLDSAARARRAAPALDPPQQALYWRMRGALNAERALVADDPALARTADADLTRADRLLTSTIKRAGLAATRFELRGAFEGLSAALPLLHAAEQQLLASRQPGSLWPTAGHNELRYVLEQQAIACRDLYTETGTKHYLDKFCQYATRLAALLAHQREYGRLALPGDPALLDAAVVADNYALAVEAMQTRYARYGQPEDLAMAFGITENAKAWRLLARVGGDQAGGGMAGKRLLRAYRTRAATLRRWQEVQEVAYHAPKLRHLPLFVAARDSAPLAQRALDTAAANLRRARANLFAAAFNGSYALPFDTIRARLPADGQTVAVEFLRRTSREDGLEQQSVFAFVISRDTKQLLRLPLPDGFAATIDSLVRALAQPGSPAYPRLAARLYQLLLAPVAAKLPPGTRRLLIAPDAELWRVPFEALLTESVATPTAAGVDFRTLPYVLRRWQITYAHSLTLQERARQTTAAGTTGVLALAPFSDPAVADGLPFSGQLVERLQATLSGDFYRGAAASREAFRQKAEGAQVLHLATHAMADPLDPTTSALVLADGRLPLPELFALAVRPQLVVLSACETGVGQLYGASESLTSLSWGFAYAGAASTIATLWRVDDAATAALLTRFYGYLRADRPRGEALHCAKLVALDSAATAAAADPFYWSGLVLTGDERPLHLARTADRAAAWLPWSAAGLTVVAVVAAGAWWWRWRRRNARFGR